MSSRKKHKSNRSKAARRHGKNGGSTPREQRSLNARLLGVTAAVFLVAAGGVFALRQYRQVQLADYLKDRATLLAEESEWQEATFYLQRYLQVSPEDFQARLDLVDASSQMAQQGGSHDYLVRLLYETIGLAGEENAEHAVELQSQLAGELLLTREFKTASDEAEKVLDSGGKRFFPGITRSEEQTARALRVKALAECYSVPPRGTVAETERRAEFAMVLPDLITAMEANPGDIPLARAAATIYRTYYRPYPLPVEAPDTSFTDLADQVMDRLVENSPEDPNALVARYLYRKRYSLGGAAGDLDAAIALDPAHLEAQAWKGLEAWAQNTPESLEAAKACFTALVEQNADQEAGYLLLSKLLWGMGDCQQAIAVLEDAASSLPLAALESRFRQAEYLLLDGQHEQAEPLVEKLRGLVDAQLSRLRSQDRATITHRTRLLEAGLIAAKGDLSAALVIYRAIATSPDLAVGTPLAHQASQGLAHVLARMGRWDQAAQELDRYADQLQASANTEPGVEQSEEDALSALARSGDEYRQARVQASEAYLRSGRPGEAIKQLEMLEAPTSASELAKQPGVVELRLRAELAFQLDALPRDRRWEEFQLLLEEARPQLPKSQQLFLAGLKYRLAVMADDQGGPAEVASLLEEGASQFAESGIFWRIASVAYLEINNVQKAEEALGEYLDLETDPAKKAGAQVAFLSASGKTDQALQWLAGELKTAVAEEKRLLERLEVQLLVQSDARDQALDKAVALAESTPDQLSLVLAWELAVSQGDLETAKQLEDKLTQSKHVTLEDQQYFKASRLLGGFASLTEAEKVELDQLVASLRSARPFWLRGVVLAAKHADARGDVTDAIEAYERALALGDRNPKDLERLALNLYLAEDYDRAEQVIERLSSGSWEVSSDTESLAISTAVQQRQLDKAINLARQSVEDHPEDETRRLWLCNVLLADQQTDEAERVLLAARGKFPESAILWDAQFSHFVRINQLDQARKLLEELPPAISGVPYNRSLALARGNELLGDHAEAGKHYQKALRLKPSNNLVRLRYADLLLQRDTQGAQTQYEAILKRDPKNADARRNLAALLATSGDPSSWQRIDKLLAAAGDSNDIRDRRLRAILLTRRGRSVKERAANCELARRILTGIVEDSPAEAEDVDRLLLARAYEQEGILKRDPTSFESARSVLRYLIDRPDAPQNYRNLYIAYLLRSIGNLDEILESGSIRTSFIRDAKGRIEDLRDTLNDSGSEISPLQEQTLVGLDVRLLKAEGKTEEALERVAQYAKTHVETEADEATRARLTLGLGSLYSLLEAHGLAEPWYRELTEVAPGAKALLSQSLIQQGRSADAVGIFLESSSEDLTPKGAAKLASLLATSDADSATLELAWPVVSDVLEKHPEDIDLLIAVAILQVTRGEEDEAIRLFRRVLEQAPEHVLALNNLATLLGERGSDRTEALEFIGRAIKAAGREPALLDTQGTIQLQLGNASEAIASLEEAVAPVNVDPRYYFHLAAAYLSGGMKAEAAQAMDEARRRGLDKAVLTTADRELMREVEAGLGGSHTALKEAA